MNIGENGRGLMKALMAVQDNEIRTVSPVLDDPYKQALETLLIKSMQRAKYFVAGKFPEEQFRHYALNVPLYTHFTSPIRRYADIIVHRQLQSALANESTPPEESQSLIKLAENCNFKKDAARNAQEQSIHLFLCRMLKDMSAPGPVSRCGIVVNVQSSSFDVVIPEFGIEKRVHLDQLPLIKAEFDRSNRVLELFWEKGVDSMSFNPEEVKSRQRTTTSGSLMGNGKSHWRSDSQAEDELNLAVSSMGLDDNMALFDAPVPDSPPTKALRVPAIQTNTSIQATRSAPTSPVHPPTDANSSWVPGLPTESGRTASLMNVTIGESNGRPSTSGTDKEPVEELREEEGVQVIRELCRVWVTIRAEVAGEAKSGGSLIFLKAMNPFP
jgi:protein SSD1